MTSDHGEPPTRSERFGEYAAAAARAAGYDIDSPRGGGKKALAEAAGMSHASVSRMLAGQTIPDPKFFSTLAKALGVPMWNLLIHSGLVPDEEEIPRNPVHKPATLAEVAASIGLKDPRSVALFEGMVKSLLAQETDEGDSSEGAA